MSGNLNPNLFRLSLPEWLKEQVSSGVHKSVYWIDEKEKVFHVPWKHASRNGWEDGDVSLFKAWAIYTNRYREGIDKPKPALWKTNFRCAINSHNHIFFVKDQGERRGDQAHRIMKIVDQENCKPTTPESSPWESMKKRVRMTYPSSGEPNRKRSKGGSKTLCDNCKTHYSESCPKCQLKLNNDNNNHLKLSHADENFFEHGGPSGTFFSNEESYMPIPMRKPNLQDLCKALKSMNDASPLTTATNIIKHEGYEPIVSHANPMVKQEIDGQFTARSTQTPVIVTHSSNLEKPGDSDYDTRSCSSDDDHDELIMPRVSP